MRDIVGLNYCISSRLEVKAVKDYLGDKNQPQFGSWMDVVGGGQKMIKGTIQVWGLSKGAHLSKQQPIPEK